MNANDPPSNPTSDASNLDALRNRILELEQLEIALRESESSYRAIIDHQEDLICRYRAGDYIILFVNLAFCRFYHKTPEQLLGTSILDTLHERERAARKLLIDQLAERKEMFSYEHRSVDAEGVSHWHKWTDIPLCAFNDGEIQVVIQSSATNISTQKVNEQVLRRSADELSSLTELASRHDLALEQKIARILRMGVNFMGMEIGILSRVDRGVYQVHQQHPAAEAGAGAVGSSAHTITQATMEATKPVCFSRASGDPAECHPAFPTRRVASYIGQVVVIEDKPYGTLDFVSFRPRATSFTETERTFVCLASQWIGYELGRITNHNALLEKSNELMRSNNELEQFAYIVTHDLQEPLRTVNSFAEIFEATYRQEIDSEGQEMLRFILDGSRRMSQLIQDLLTYSRVTTDPMPFREIDMNALCQKVLGSLRLAIDESKGTVSVDPLPTINGDSAQISRLMLNLIGNALKFNRGSPPIVHLSGQQIGPGVWRFSIADQGIGIDREHRERIFHVFHRLHGREAYEGTGIGLAVCKRIVERHGGVIRAQDHDGPGATFTFTIRTGPPS
ncbi:MAG: PAS domain S-box-containing protein [Kiritimatiellia bacterium]